MLELVFVSLLHPLEELEGRSTLSSSLPSSLPQFPSPLLPIPPSPSATPTPLFTLLSPSLNLGKSSSSQE